MGTARMGDNCATSVVDADCRSLDIPNLWVCDGSVFPTSGGVNPSLTIQAIACRTGDRIAELARKGELLYDMKRTSSKRGLIVITGASAGVGRPIVRRFA